MLRGWDAPFDFAVAAATLAFIAAIFACTFELIADGFSNALVLEGGVMPVWAGFAPCKRAARAAALARASAMILLTSCLPAVA
jgi:hypothetical protein